MNNTTDNLSSLRPVSRRNHQTGKRDDSFVINLSLDSLQGMDSFNVSYFTYFRPTLL